ncbi:TetR/AcrR family transcriptional regulator [Streptomyces sp. Vc74B-19]|uniref:ScbR family autoregulator-binding transcription factor n=1 Tax=unclassified Streptomyces TaxID=2593676 RepID=UPI001BFC9BEE|nr:MULTISPECIES: ScbR family autoregulator-binding transcription factor [unclassified Streptomyces]MBT3166074.1 TetR/AcrR family transcriptional regulator [Streptomyces sp. Vc74B-19]MCO4695321.1 TetR family transcriptional regulator [Streptomyces sp. RO-S4]
MARQVRAEKTRATIITAAADLFDRQGYESTSLSDIVEHARVTKGALYFHFAAKEDLAHAVLELQSTTCRRLARDTASRGRTSLEALMRLTFCVARMSAEDPVLRAGLRLATGGTRPRPPLSHPFTEWLDLVTARLEGAVEESDVHPDVDIDAVAHSLVCFFVGTRVVGRTREDVSRQPRRTAEMWQLLVRGLVPVTRRARYLSLAARLEREIAPL